MRPTSKTDKEPKTLAQAPEQWLTAKQVSELLGKSPGTLSRWRSRGTGPQFLYSIPGNPRSAARYPASAVAAWQRR